MTVQISPIATSISYTVGATVTDTFTVPFPFDDDGDLVVLVDGTAVAFTVTSGTVDTGIFTAASVVLAVPVSNVTVVLYRATALAQEAVFPLSGAFRPATLNREVSRLWMAGQDRAEREGHAMRTAAHDGTLTVLPIAASRANKALLFDADGQPVAGEPADGVIGIIPSAFGSDLMLAADAEAARDVLEIGSLSGEALTPASVAATGAVSGATLASTGNATVGGNATVSGTLAVTGAATAASLSTTGGVTADTAGTMPLTVAPVANPLTTGSSMTIATTTQSEVKREFALTVGLVSNKGGTRANPSLAWQDKVAIYGGVQALAGTGDVWSLNTVVTMEAGSGGNYHAQGYELDFNNLQGHRGDADAGSGLAGFVAYGLSITGAGAYRSTSALLIAGPGTGIWNRGIVVAASSISSTGSTFQDLCAGHSKSLDIRGSPTWGLYQTNPGTSNYIGGTYLYLGAPSAPVSPCTAGVDGATYRHASGWDVYAAAATPLSVGRGDDGTAIGFFRGAGVGVGSITVSASATAYNTSSDYRLKDELELLTGALDRVEAVPVHRFRWLAAPTAPKVDGFLAHEAAAAVPEAVHGAKDAVDAIGNPIYQGIDQSKLVPVLWAAVQELKALTDTLTARVAALEAVP